MGRKNGNWTIKGRRKIFENDFFKVFEDEVIQPDGKDGTYQYLSNQTADKKGENGDEK